VPRIAKTDNTAPKNDNRTTNPQPSLVGTYEANTTIQIVDPNTQAVLGSAPAAANGQYSVRFASPLAPGTYTVRMRAVGPQGATSLFSRPFRFVILQPTPQGPRALAR
jgi:hypothetical protein